MISSFWIVPVATAWVALTAAVTPCCVVVAPVTVNVKFSFASNAVSPVTSTVTVTDDAPVGMVALMVFGSEATPEKSSRIGRGGRELQRDVDRTDGAVCPLDGEGERGGAGVSFCVRHAGRGRRDTNLLGITRRQCRIDRQAGAAIAVARRISFIGGEDERRSSRESAALMNLVTSGALPSPAAGGL